MAGWITVFIMDARGGFPKCRELYREGMHFESRASRWHKNLEPSMRMISSRSDDLSDLCKFLKLCAALL